MFILKKLRTQNEQLLASNMTPTVSQKCIAKFFIYIIIKKTQ